MINELEDFLFKKPILIGAIVLIFILFFVSFFFYPVSQKNEETPVISPTPVVYATLVLTKKPDQQKLTYKNQFYSVYYPNDWATQEFTTTNGTALVIKPKSLGQEFNYPSFNIFQSDSKQTQDTSIFTSMGFTKTEESVNGKEITKFTGSLPFKIVNGKTASGEVQETDLLLDHNGRHYQIKYEYEGKKDAKMEAEFMQIMESLTLY